MKILDRYVSLESYRFVMDYNDNISDELFNELYSDKIISKEMLGHLSDPNGINMYQIIQYRIQLATAIITINRILV